MKKSIAIEDYWEDFIIYSVAFITLDNRIIYKKIVLEEFLSLEEIRAIIIKQFNNVKSVKHIDYIEDCLVSKK